MKRKVLIAVPSVDGNVGVHVAHFLCQAEKLNADPDCPFTFNRLLLVGYKPVEYMRNSLCRAFLETDAELLWMMDADMVPPPHAVKMLEVDADMVAGAVIGYKAGENGDGIALRWLAYTRTNGVMTSIRPAPGQQEIDGAGTGSLIIHRRVIEDSRLRLAPDPPEEQRDAKWAPAVFRMPTKPWGEKETTADLDFCGRARDLGYRIVLWADEMFGQTETLNLTDVYGYGIECMRRLEAAKGL